MLHQYRLFIVLLFIVTPFSQVVFADQLLSGISPYKPDTYRLFSIHGSNTIGANLGPEMVKAFLKANGAKRIQQKHGDRLNEYLIRAALYQDNLPVNIEVAIEAHGSSTGFKGLLSGEADIAASSRPIKKQEELKLLKEGNMRSLSNEHILAIDGLAIVVHPNNIVSSLSTTAIKDIFTGKVTRWSQVGGVNKPIRILARDDKSGTYDTFKGLILRKSPLVKGAERYESNDEISRQVSRDPHAIGFVALASIGKDKPLQVSDGEAQALTPNTLSIATEDYPLSRRLYFYSRHPSKNTYAVNQFLEFIKSDQGQAVVAKTGFIAQSLFPLKVAEDNDWQRLNMNIRFQEGSSKLDNKAAVDVSRLVEFINRPENQYMQLKLVGFSNPTDSNANPDAVSRIRAQNVRWALRSSGLDNKVKAEAGTTMSVADPESINANKNRRVEVWVQ